MLKNPHQETSVENFKRRRALPACPGSSPDLAGDTRFFNRLLITRKEQEFVFITKAVAKNR